MRVRSIGRTERPALPVLEAASAPVTSALKGERRAYVPLRDAFERVPVYDGHALRPGHSLAGPALVERVDTTFFVAAAAKAQVDPRGSLVVTLEACDA